MSPKIWGVKNPTISPNLRPNNSLEMAILLVYDLNLDLVVGPLRNDLLLDQLFHSHRRSLMVFSE